MNELERLNAHLSEAKDKFKEAQKNHHQAAIIVFEANENLVKCQKAFYNELDHESLVK